MHSESGDPGPGNRTPSSARTKLLVSLAVAVPVGVLAAVLGAWRDAPLISWDCLVLVFCSWVWATVWNLDAESTRSHAKRENPGRDLADLVLVGASVASLIAVGVVLLAASGQGGAVKYLQAGLAVVSVFVSWTLVHTVFALKYARLYYQDPVGGIDFNQDELPQYSDFAYLAFTIGMTFQVSDTNIRTKLIRRATLRHAWISFPLGAVIIATMINLISGLAK